MMLKIEFMNIIAETDLPPVTKGRFMKTLDKYTAFDMAIALSAYDALVLD